MMKTIGIAAALTLLPYTAFGQANELQLVREIGVEHGPEEYSFGHVGGIAFTVRKEILILDSQAKLVRRFDLTGKHLGTFGREGAGPGEFQLPRIRAVRDEIWISDPRLQRLTIFGLDGRVIITVSPPAALGVVDVAYPLRNGMWLGTKTVSNFSSQHIRQIRGARAARQSSLFQSWRSDNASRLVLAHADIEALDTIATWDTGSIPWFAEDGSSFGFVRRSWGALGGWGLGGDSIIAHVSSVDGSVKVWLVRAEQLEMIKMGRLPITPERIGEPDVNRLAEQERARTGKQVRLIVPPLKGQLAPPIISNTGDVWILRASKHPFGEQEVGARNYLVVPIDHRAQFRVTLPEGFTLYAVVNDLLLGKRKTENDVDIVQIWRLPQLNR